MPSVGNSHTSCTHVHNFKINATIVVSNINKKLKDSIYSTQNKCNSYSDFPYMEEVIFITLDAIQCIRKCLSVHVDCTMTYVMFKSRLFPGAQRRCGVLHW